MSLRFLKCYACIAKPGTPSLCPSCLHNRDLIANLQKENIILKELCELQKTDWGELRRVLDALDAKAKEKL